MANGNVKTVLVVDEARDSRVALCRVFGDEYRTLEAEDGARALKIIKAQPDIAAVLLNMSAPQAENALRAIKDDELLSRVHVIALTAHGDERSQLKALDMGASCVIAMPLSPRVMLHYARGLIERGRSEALAEQNRLYLERLAQTEIDEKCGIYNKRGFINHTAALLKDNPGRRFVLVRWDIDRFKVYNDIYGVAAGDRLLASIGEAYRSLNVPLLTYGHWESDHFVNCMPLDAVDADELSAHISGTIARFHRDYDFVIRIGLYIIDDPTIDIELMCDRAQLALHSVKGSYNKRYAYYDVSMREALIEEQALTGEMENALNEEQFLVYIQPQYNYDANELCGAEALVRWLHPRSGLIMPGRFIPLFERNGFISRLDEYVWRHTCALIRGWLDKGLNVPPVSVNISRQDIYNPGLCDTLYGLVREYNLETRLLRLEITESAYVNNPDQLIRVVEQLRQRGFYVEMDDFGSGYSSLNILKDVPVDMLKLDMRFLDPGDSATERSGSILSAVVRMVNMLGLDVIAEGVETRAQAEFLKSISCFNMQGYLFCKPIPPEEFEALLRTGVSATQAVIAGERDVSTVDFLNSASQEALIFNSFVSGAGIIEYTDGRLAALRLNDRYFEVLGISRQDYLPYQYNLLERFDEAERPNIIALIDDAIKTGDEVMAERRSRPFRENGESIWLEVRMRRLAKKGDSYLLYLSLDNITKRKQLEEHNLRLSQRLMALIDTVPGGIFAYDAADDDNDRFWYVSDTLLTMLGYTRDEFMEKFNNRFSGMVWHEDRQAALQKKKHDIDRTGDYNTCEYRIQTKSGELKWVFDAGRLVVDANGDRYYIVVVVDNDEKKALELRLSQENAEMQTLIDAIPGGVATYEVRQDGFKLVYASSGVGALSGRTGEEYAEMINTEHRLGVYPPDEPMAERAIRKCVEDGGDVDVTFRVPHKDGSLVWINLRGRRLGERNGQPVFHAVYLNQSVTMDLYRSIIDESTDALVVADKATREVLFANAAALRMCATDDGRYIEKTCHKLLMNEDEICEGCPVSGLAAVPLTREFDRNGRHYITGVTSITWNGRDAFISYITDLTEEWRAQNKLQRVLSNIPSALSEFRVDNGEITRVYRSASAHAILGYDYADDDGAAETGVSQALKRIHPDDLPGFEQVLNDALARRIAFEADFRVVTPQNVQKWVNLKANPVEMDDGALHYYCVYNDVTARKQQEEALRIRGEEYRLLTERNGKTIVRYDIKTGQADLSEAYAGMLGVQPDADRLGERLVEGGQVSPESTEAWRDFFTRISEGDDEGRAEVRIRLADERRRWISLWFASVKGEDGSPVSALISVEDITEQREIAKNRAFERSSLFAALRMVYPLILAVNLSQNSFYALERRNFITSKANTDGIFDKLIDLSLTMLPPDDAKRFSATFGREALLGTLNAGSDVVRLEYRQYGDDGTLHWVETTVLRVDNPYDDDVLELTLTRQIDESKGNEERLARALESTEDSLTRQERMREIIRRNLRSLVEVWYEGESAPAYRLGNIAALYGYTDGEFDRLRRGTGDKTTLAARISADEAMARGDARYEAEYRISVKHGGQAWVMERGELFTDEDGRRGYVITYVDNTPNRSLLERLRINEEELRLVAARMGAYFLRYDIKRRKLSLPDDYARLWGVGEMVENAPDSICARSEIFYDEAAERGFNELYERILRGEPSGECELHLMRPATGEAWEHVEFVTISDAEGEPSRAVLSVIDTTARHRQDAETAELKHNEQIMRAVAEHSGRVVYFYDPATGLANALDGGQCAALGLPDSCEPERLERECELTPESVEALQALFESIREGEPRGNAKLHLHDQNGKERWLELRFSGLLDEDDRTEGAVLSFLDITGQHMRELAYARYRQTIAETSTGRGMYFETDITDDIVAKHGSEVLDVPATGRSYSEMLSYLLDKYVDPNERDKAYRLYSREHLLDLYRRGSREILGDWQITGSDGKHHWARVSMQLVTDPYTNHVRGLAIINDITEAKELLISVQQQAEIDGLTGIYNRSTAETRIKALLGVPHGRCALMIIDLDNLKRINDTLGHRQGDRALRAVGEELQRRFRSTDVVGRLGGDEYIVFLPGVKSEASVRIIIAKLLRRLSTVAMDDGRGIHCSIGCALGSHETDSFEELYRRADLALYHVKRHGKNDFAFFTPEME